MLDAFDENGQILVWNRRCEEVTGYSAEEIIGNPKAFELLYPDPEYRELVLNRVNRDKDYTDETIVTCKDGGQRTIIWIH
ncbi:MAG: PAS domain-containing protein, partial [Saprospiraceae bacterium]|nr:PAS domain-containing protein [Saprospiraceae bacterium]